MPERTPEVEIVIHEGSPLTKTAKGTTHRSTIEELVKEIQRLRGMPLPATMKERVQQQLVVIDTANTTLGNLAGELIEAPPTPTSNECRAGLHNAKHHLGFALTALLRIVERIGEV